jgi:Mce-associated membrane protein
MESLMETEPGDENLESPEPGSTADTPRAGRRLRLTAPLVLVASLLAAAAVICAAFFGIRWAVDSHSDTIAFSQARDDALRAGEQAIKNFNTIDYHNVQGGLAVWKASATGDLYNEVVGYTKNNDFISTIQKAKVVTTAKILDAAVTDLNTHDGKATVIAAVDITVTPEGQKPTDKRSRIEGNLTRTDSGWLLSAVQPVPVPSTGQ